MNKQTKENQINKKKEVLYKNIFHINNFISSLCKFILGFKPIVLSTCKPKTITKQTAKLIIYSDQKNSSVLFRQFTKLCICLHLTTSKHRICMLLTGGRSSVFGNLIGLQKARQKFAKSCGTRNRRPLSLAVI